MSTPFADEKRHALAVLAAVQTKYRRWIDANNSGVHREDELYTAWNELATLGREYRKIDNHLMRELYRFAGLFENFEREVRESHEDGAVPGGELFASWDALEDFLTRSKRRSAPPLESLDELKRLSHLTDLQIANMYGWFTEDDKPDADRVRRELAVPSEKRVTPPNPSQARFDAEYQAITEEVAHYRTKRRQRQEIDGRIAPESWDELFRTPGMTADQASEMKGCSIAAVDAEADALEVPRLPRRKGLRPVTEDVDMEGDEGKGGGAPDAAKAAKPPKAGRQAKGKAAKPQEQAPQTVDPAQEAEEVEFAVEELKGYMASGYSIDEAAQHATGIAPNVLSKAVAALKDAGSPVSAGQ